MKDMRKNMKRAAAAGLSIILALSWCLRRQEERW